MGAFAGLIVPGWHSDLFGFGALLGGMVVNSDFRKLIKNGLIRLFSKGSKEETPGEMGKTKAIGRERR